MFAVSPKQTLLMFLWAVFFLWIFKAQILILFETNYIDSLPITKQYLRFGAVDGCSSQHDPNPWSGAVQQVDSEGLLIRTASDNEHNDVLWPAKHSQ